MERSGLSRPLTGIFVLLVMLCSIAAAQGPRLDFEQNRWDFGRVKQGKILTHVFEFRNSGDQPLKITRVRSTCGCTAALLSKRELAPGEKGEVKVTFNTRGYGGRLSKYIVIESNDTKQPRVQLTVAVAIDVPPQPKIQLSWYSKDVGLLLEGEPVEAEVTIKNEGELELEVAMSHQSAVFFRGRRKISQLKIPSGKEIEIRMTITPRKNRGLLREYVLLKTNDPQRSNMSLYVSGYLVTRAQLGELFRKYGDEIK